MTRTTVCLCAVAVVLAALVTGCSQDQQVSPLYLLEELEAATARSDPEERIEALEIFVENHKGHHYRATAYARILDVMANELGDGERAARYLGRLLESESDPLVRGMVCYRWFAHLWKDDREQAISYAEGLVAGQESYYRLYLYISYYLVWDDAFEENAGLAERVLGRAIESAKDRHERNQAIAVLGTLKEKLGRPDEAYEILLEAEGTPDADEALGGILWERGERERALEYYIRYTAVIPGAREHLSLDSLYALVYPDAEDLDARIWAERIFDGDELARGRFVDINGKEHDLGPKDDLVLVVNIWQPT